MQKSANEQSVTAQKGRSIHFCVANAESHQQLLQAATYFKVKSILEKIPPISWPLMSKHFVRIRRKNSLFTGINVRQNQARGWAFICYDCLGSEGKEKRRKQEQRERRQKCNILYWYRNHMAVVLKPHQSTTGAPTAVWAYSCITKGWFRDTQFSQSCIRLLGPSMHCAHNLTDAEPLLIYSTCINAIRWTNW